MDTKVPGLVHGIAHIVTFIHNQVFSQKPHGQQVVDIRITKKDKGNLVVRTYITNLVIHIVNIKIGMGSSETGANILDVLPAY